MVDLAIGGTVSRDEIFDLCNKIKDAFADGKAGQARRAPPLKSFHPHPGPGHPIGRQTASESGQGFTLVSPSPAMIDASRASAFSPT